MEKINKNNPDAVGPVLQKGSVSEAVIEAIRELNSTVKVISNGAYFRILCFPTCRLTRLAVESRLGRPFVLPKDLEAIMPSFKGHLEITSEEITWSSKKAKG
jgi:hypothetical protein